MEKNTTQLLVTELNMLLETLDIPIRIASPLDLLPSLLSAILDAIIEEDLSTEISLCLEEHSLSNALIETPDSHKRVSDIERMQIFLGVLEHDVIKGDVGLHKVDPIRLAEGGWEETVTVANVLCWFGRHHGLIFTSELHTSSPTTSSRTRTTSVSAYTSSSAFANVPEESMTSLDEDAGEYRGSLLSESCSFLPEPNSPFIPYTPAVDTAELIMPPFLLGDNDSTIKAPRSRHESSENTSSDNTMNANSGNPNASVRHEGYINLAEEESEISWYEHHSRSMSSNGSKASRSLTQDLLQESHRTLALLEQRAKLLSEFQRLRRRGG